MGDKHFYDNLVAGGNCDSEPIIMAVGIDSYQRVGLLGNKYVVFLAHNVWATSLHQVASLSVCLSVCLFVCLPVCLSDHVSVNVIPLFDCLK